MSVLISEKFNKYSNFLELCNLGALLHDLGKLDIDFLISKEPASQVKDYHGQIIFKDKDIIPNYLYDFLITPFGELCECPHIFKKFSLLNFICSHHGCSKCFLGSKCSYLEDHPLRRFLHLSDCLDTSNPSDKGKQFLKDIKYSNFFGKEYSLDYENFSLYRKKLYDEISPVISGRKSLKEKLEDLEKILETYLSKGICETRKWAHDIDLYSHGRSVSLYLRIILLNYLSDGIIAKNSEDIIFKTLKIYGASQEELYRISEKIEREFFAVPIYKDIYEALFFVYRDFEKDYLTCVKFDLSPQVNASMSLDEIIPDNIFPGKGISLDLKACFEYASNFYVKTPEDIKDNYHMEDLIRDIKACVDYGTYCDLLKQEEKRDSLLRHVNNIKKGKDNDKFSYYKEKLGKIQEEIDLIGDSTSFEEKYDWKDKSDAAYKIWEFLSIVLSSIRPHEPLSLVKLWGKKYKIINEEIVTDLVLRKQITAGRLFSLIREVRNLYKELSYDGKHITGDLSLIMDKLPEGKFWKQIKGPEGIFNF
jgi:hypothetical protein